MRVNVYSQELLVAGDFDSWRESGLPVVELLKQQADTHIVYSAVRMYLQSPPWLHARKDDDDRSAITYWLPKSPSRREELAKQFERLAELVRAAPPETGLD